MSDSTIAPPGQVTGFAQRPKRADARRNYEKLLRAAGDAFEQDGTAASLEDIARRAEVGIGTLYRHFPTRQALLEAVYVDEVEEMSAKAGQLDDLDPWDALVTWLRQFVRYAATKRALMEEMANAVDADAPVFAACRTAITSAGDMLLRRAQEAGEAREDTNFSDVGRMVSGIAGIRAADPGQIERILDMALDGLRAGPG
ncbi:MAG TPA: TetR/AcrR family transcriptional regulator [Baekduia sp.]|uniref:TetR/AcrR family transcriptional regulator n=1 Tax=Baekduia sp. TaxID=2600305 RepID=UPI002D765F91|nr:TetR/AcrR family transcriptional regulator [Baekduia sp.]HET6507137.1 TetR/AcrR family transcriptional regulator [Baekduia sp.]